MRPVTLELDGFGSFRDPAVVDFTEADYFALIGPTGSGKSTVIDAITFALYGSVPRWDNQLIVSLALAPSTNRGTVKLVFDVSGARYVVARELRRAKSGQVTVKNVRLDKLVDAQGSGAEGEPAQNLASDRAVTPAIEGLLGLTFEHFCTCVVLPQGDFAEFLHKKPGDRDKLLRSLLGIDVYTDMMQAANSLAKQHEAQASAKQGQLDRLEYATQEHVDQTTARVTELTGIRPVFDDSLVSLKTAREHADERAKHRQACQTDFDAVAGMKAPEDLAELGARDKATATVLADAAKTLAAAEQADTDARRAQFEGPDAEALRSVLALRRQAGDAEVALPKASAAADAASTALKVATSELEEAQLAEEAARAQHSDAQAASQQAATRLAAAEVELTRLTTVKAPPDLDEMDARLQDAKQRLAQHEKDHKGARAAVTAAAQLLDEAPKASALERLLDIHATFEATCQMVTDLEQSREETVAAHAKASSALQEAAGLVATLRADFQALQRQDLAAALRPHLHVGESCPVCEQTVISLPGKQEVNDITSFENALKEAERSLEALRDREKTASNAVAAAKRAVTSEQARRDTIKAQLGDASRNETQAQFDKVQQLQANLAAGQQRQDEAERLVDVARTNLESMRTAVAESAHKLQQARDPLVALGAPPTTDDTVASWRSLVEWVAARLPEQEDAVAAFAGEAAATRTRETETNHTLAQKSAHLVELRKRAGDLALVEQSARSELTRLTDLLARLRTALEGKPTVDEATQRLDIAAGLIESARNADKALAAARGAVRAANQSRADFEGDRVASRQQLGALRDSVVHLGAPPLDDDDDLADAWSRLLSWAKTVTKTKKAELQAADTAAKTATATAESAALTVTQLLKTHGVDIEDDSSAAAAMAFGRAVAAAEAAATQAHEDHRNREQLLEQIQADQENAQVANLLGNLLRTDAFPRWLIGSALDVLVADASENLRELSGGQFDLTHVDGAFFVIDHTDAEAIRPVKTLSGGETFQASLALALALSNHLTTLATDGTAKLESIFLDEGFGTLDDAMLEIVAETLENLASQGKQMVGLVTHVKALAERVPVRFEVSRDQSTSRITRVGG